MTNLPKNFVLQLGSLIALYVSIAAFITLIFTTINIAVPDAVDSSWMEGQNQAVLRTTLSLLIVFFPTYLFLTRKVNVALRNESGAYAAVTKWLIYLSLLAGGLVMMIDLVVTINTFLDGELTTRFAMKAIALLVVMGSVFYYYLLDARGHWQLREQYSIMYGAMATAIVLGMMVASLYHLETPGEVRAKKIDQEQVYDLQDISWRVQSHHKENNALPVSTDELYLSEALPQAAAERADYQYKIVDETSYELCPEFAHEATDNHSRYSYDMDIKGSNWDHGDGEWCFERNVAKDSDG